MKYLSDESMSEKEGGEQSEKYVLL